MWAPEKVKKSSKSLLFLYCLNRIRADIYDNRGNRAEVTTRKRRTEMMERTDFEAIARRLERQATRYVGKKEAAERVCLVDETGYEWDGLEIGCALMDAPGYGSGMFLEFVEMQGDYPAALEELAARLDWALWAEWDGEEGAVLRVLRSSPLTQGMAIGALLDAAAEATRLRALLVAAAR